MSTFTSILRDVLILLLPCFSQASSTAAFVVNCKKNGPLSSSSSPHHRSFCSSRTQNSPLPLQPATSILRRPAFLASSNSEGNGESSNDSSTSSAAATAEVTPSPQPPPMFNGKRIMPGSIVLAGLKASSSGSRVAAVYAIYDSKSSGSSSSNDWTTTLHVGTTQDLYSTLTVWESTVGKINRIRALSFSTFAPNAMQEMVQQWKKEAQEAGATLMDWIDPSPYLDDDDDDDEDDDWDVGMTTQSMASVTSNGQTASADSEGDIISPFAGTKTAEVTTAKESEMDQGDLPLPFTVESVDRVLEEVRPYLVADGGNVAVVNVLVDQNSNKKTVQLELQGACGSCPSSTVTMKMGIERVLREQFGPSVVVEQVQPRPADNSSESSYYRSLVEEELNRLSQAVSAMGGTVRIVDVKEDTGEVQIFFQGPAKLRQGLELALRDVVPSVEFVQE
ncbi:hypothetical protein ACA910_001661 [Epithemia clementina (nom. ined.)]